MREELLPGRTLGSARRRQRRRRSAVRPPRRSRARRPVPGRVPARARDALHLYHAASRHCLARDRRSTATCRSAGSTRPPGNTYRPGMNTMSAGAARAARVARPTSVSTMISVAASRGRNALRGLAAVCVGCARLAHRLLTSCVQPDRSNRRARLRQARVIARPACSAARGSNCLRPRNARAGACPDLASRRQLLALARRQHLEAQRAGGSEWPPPAAPDVVAQPVAPRPCGRRPARARFRRGGNSRRRASRPA